MNTIESLNTMVDMHPEFVGLLSAVNCTTIFRMGILPFLQKKGSGTGKRK